MRNMEESKTNIERNYIQSMKQLAYVLELNKEMIEGKDETQEVFLQAQSSENIINSFDVIIREDAIFSIARYQPVAKNLRFFTMIIDSSRLVERMGDLLKACLKLLKSILDKDPKMVVLLKEHTIFMIEQIEDIYTKYMEAFFQENADLGYEIIKIDDVIDKITKEIYEKIIQLVNEGEYNVEALFWFWNLHKKYERFTDHIIHLTIDFIYIMKGENLRKKELESQQVL